MPSSTPPPNPSANTHKRPNATTSPTPTIKRTKTTTPPSDLKPSNMEESPMPPPTPDNMDSAPAPSNESTTAPATTPSPSPTHLTLTYHQGSLFTAPPHTLLIHACNTLGKWGAGIALAFKHIYPSAYKTYYNHCASKPARGTALLIAPSQPPGQGQAQVQDQDPGTHWIGCLFTSAKYGRNKDAEDVILRSTGQAMRDLLRSIAEMEKDGFVVGTVRMCKINSGKFGVEWEATEQVLREIVIEEGWRGEVEVWEP
ncbi:hypothetical protein P154DRAFT_527947 [Amniculicola lignicola CBS 123094]|uniref:ADP-ribose 1''-phosphate phosphatase n=1 Tax=Amniculicola lignicola CBS 123094 TaxID=1392246 RepID=A0A6A5VTQ4_9PLEO|nr:hypothetical protein P154DRAFT_527947 [Amniculicola lignicola CBS 123094]